MEKLELEMELELERVFEGEEDICRVSLTVHVSFRPGGWPTDDSPYLRSLLIQLHCNEPSIESFTTVKGSRNEFQVIVLNN